MSSMELFPDSGRNKYKWQAYVSSALTISDAAVRERIKGLNTKIQSWLQELAGTFVYLPQEYSDPSRGDKMKPEEIYILDRWRIAESDFVIMNMDLPSFGVGQEAEIACSMGIPIIAFHYSGFSVSRIIRGIPAIFSGDAGQPSSEGIIKYDDLDNYEDLKNTLLARVHHMQQLVKPVQETTGFTQSFSERLEKAIQKSGKTKEFIAQESGFTEAFLDSLLNHYKSVESVLEPYGLLKLCKLRKIPIDRYLNPGLWVLRKLSAVLNIRVSALIGEEELDRLWHQPLRLASRNGVTLEEFISVSEKTDFMVIYQKAAKSFDDEEASQEVSNQIMDLVEQLRHEETNAK